MSSSQTITQVDSTSRILLRAKAQTFFPAAWRSLEPSSTVYVIDRAYWNAEPAPDKDFPMTVKWDEFSGTRRLLSRQDYGVEIGALIVRYYFGIEGCIVPIACCPYSDDAIFAFTLVAPPDANNKKEFYVLYHDRCLQSTKLTRCNPGFSNVADFYRNEVPAGAWKRVAPVAGGEEATENEFINCGFSKPYQEEDWPESSDWDALYDDV